MTSPEEKARHRKRLRRKNKARVRSNIAKELIVSKKYQQRVVQDKRGNKHDLDKMTFRDLVEAIEDNDN